MFEINSSIDESKIPITVFKINFSDLLSKLIIITLIGNVAIRREPIREKL